MPTYPRILNSSEVKVFENPPEFSGKQRKIYFTLPKWSESILLELRTPLNKLIFILLLGYFRFTRKFFNPKKFHIKDVVYVANIYGIPCENITFKDFKSNTLNRYKDIILKELGVKAFDSELKYELLKEAKTFVSKKFKPKYIFLSLLDLLESKNIEIPTYNVFAEVITKALNDFEKEFLAKIEDYLSPSESELLDDLLDVDEHYKTEENKDKKLKRYKITGLKKISHSTKPGKIKENINNLQIFKNLFEALKDPIKSINLSTETIQYYAVWAIKAKLFQVLRKDDKKRYLYLISFIIHQYFSLQDTLIDVLLTSVQNIINTAIREHREIFYIERKQKQEKVIDFIQAVEKKVFVSLDKIEKILYNPILPDEQKIKMLVELFEKERVYKQDLKNKLVDIKSEVKKNLDNEDYFKILEGRSKKLQNRVSNIVKNIEFDEKSSNSKLIKAINYYKNKDGAVDNHAPVDFLDDKLQDAVFDEDSKLRVSLYKVFLFEEIANKIRSGALNLKHSYKYKPFDDYLIPKDFWKLNKKELLKKAGLEEFEDFDKVINLLEKQLDAQYEKTNSNIIQNKNPYISFKNNDDFVLTTPKVEKEETNSVSDLFVLNTSISLSQILSVSNKFTNFLDSFEHFSIKHNPEKPDSKTFFAGIIGYGCNIGTNRMSKISKGVNEYELENTTNWYFSVDNIISANNKILNFMDRLDLPDIFRKDNDYNHTASDGQKFRVEGDSLNANYSYKYFGQGKGVTVYSFIDERHMLFHSTVISSSEREAAYVIDGLMNNDVIRSDIHSTDTHGYSEIIFGVTHFLGFSFAPRIKGFKDQKLYCFNSKKKYEEKGYKILPEGYNYINTKVLREKWDDILRFIATIKLKEETASQLFKRLSSYAKKHRLYQALKEFGKIIKTIFLLKYIDDVELRQAIEKQLNKIESANKFGKAVFFGNNQEFQYSTKEEQDIADGCKRLIENAIICWNYLYLSQLVLNTPDETQKKELLNVIENGSVVVWHHINLYGEYDFSEEYLKDSVGFNASKILDLNIA